MRTAILLLLILAGCTSRVPDHTVRVYAAASMTDVVTDAAAAFTAGPVSTSFSATSELARQIEDGAPADVFISADREWADYLKERGRLEGDYRVFARNTLVCIAAQGAPAEILGVKSADELVNAVRPKNGRIAIADAGVPAGRYTRGALDALGLLAHFNPLLVGQKDVRAVLRAVEAGEVDAGFVYATDVQASGKVKVLFTFDTATHPQIEYCAAVVKGGNVEGGRAFVDFLLGEQGRELLKAKGFVLPSTD